MRPLFLRSLVHCTKLLNTHPTCNSVTSLCWKYPPASFLSGHIRSAMTTNVNTTCGTAASYWRRQAVSRSFPDQIRSTTATRIKYKLQYSYLFLIEDKLFLPVAPAPTIPSRCRHHLRNVWKETGVLLRQFSCVATQLMNIPQSNI